MSSHHRLNLCCFSHSLSDSICVAVHKAYDAVVILSILIAHTSALHHSELVKAKFYGLHSFTIDGGREDKTFLVEIVGCTEYAMVHVASLLSVFLYALQYSHIDKPVGEKQTEELALHSLELVFALGGSLYVLGSTLTLSLLVYLLHQSVVCGL